MSTQSLNSKDCVVCKLEVHKPTVVCDRCICEHAKSAIERFRVFLKESVAKCSQRESEVESAIGHVEDRIQGVEIAAQELADDVSRLFDSLSAIIQRHRSELVLRISEEKRQKKESLAGMKKSLEQKRESLKLAQQQCQRIVSGLVMDIDLLLKRESTENALKESGITDELGIDKTGGKAGMMQTQVNSQHLLREVMRILTDHKRAHESEESVIVHNSVSLYDKFKLIKGRSQLKHSPAKESATIKQCLSPPSHAISLGGVGCPENDQIIHIPSDMDIDDEDSGDLGNCSVTTMPPIPNEVLKRHPAVCNGSEAKRPRFGSL